MNILAISGSLREASVNSAFCRAAARLAVAPMTVSVYRGLGQLPLFNPDLDAHPPTVVLELRGLVASADALLLASPEYAHGITGALKNALDWLVSFEEFVHKPVALVNLAPRAHHAYESLHEILTTMSAVILPEASIIIPLPGAHVTEEEMMGSPEIVAQIRGLLAALAEGVGPGGASGPSFTL